MKTIGDFFFLPPLSLFCISNRKHRLTRTQSAFSPVVFSPLFTGKGLKGLHFGLLEGNVC